MILADCHNHTSFSSDSIAPMESMIERAVSLGLKTICITDHMDYLFPKQYDMSFVFDVDAYFDKLDECRMRYGNTIEILSGIELGLRNEPDIRPLCVDYYHELAGKYPFDQLIGSTHILEYIDPYYPEYWHTHSETEGLRAYFESILENIRHYDMFQVYGHLDYLVRYLPGKTKDYPYSDYLDIIDEAFRLLIAEGRGIELNTAGYKYGLAYAHPRPELLVRYKELGGELLTIGSDGHAPEQLAYDFARARELLLSLGYRYYTVYRKCKPEFQPL